MIELSGSHITLMKDTIINAKEIRLFLAHLQDELGQMSNTAIWEQTVKNDPELQEKI